MTKNFIVTEMRKNKHGFEFAVDTFMQAKSVDDILEILRHKHAKALEENRFRVREVKGVV